MIFVDTSTTEKSEEVSALVHIIVVNAPFDISEYFNSFRKYHCTSVEFSERLIKVFRRK